MSRTRRYLLVAAILVVLIAIAFRAFGAGTTSQTQLLNALVIAATALLTGVVIWVAVSSLIGSRGRKVAVALAALRQSNSNHVVFACQVEQTFWSALRRLKAEIEDAGAGPWAAGALQGNFVCVVADSDTFSWWSVDSNPKRLLTIARGRVAAISIDSVPAGMTYLTGLILSITGTTPYTLTGVVEDESRPGYPAKLESLKQLVGSLHRGS